MLNGLIPYTVYYFRLIAHNIQGPSNASDPSANITTAMEAPDGPPLNVNMRPQNSSTLIISWEVRLEDLTVITLH